MGESVANNEHERLESLSKYDILDTPADPAFDDLASLAAQLCNVPVSLISFLDRDREWIKSEVGTSVREIPRDHAFAKRAVYSNDFVVVSDPGADEELRDNPLVKDEPHARFFAGWPLINPQGVAVGALYVVDDHMHHLTDQQTQILRVLGHEAVMLLELRRELHESRERNARLIAELDEMRLKLQDQSTEHVRVEIALKQRERQLSDAQRIAHLGSWEWDLRTNSVTWSDELFRIYGVKPNQFEATYEAYLRYVHPEDRVKTNHAVERALVARGSFNTEERIVRADGTVRVLLTCGEVIRNEKGEPARMVGCCYDITERKQIENELHHSLSLLNGTIEATADGILVVDMDQKIVQFNRKFAELWHFPKQFASIYEEGRLVNIASDQLKDPVGFRQKVASIYKSPECDSFDVLEFKDGRTFERYSCPQYLGGKPVGRVWSFRDVTERERAVQVMRLSEERYRSLVLASAQIVWSTDAAGQVMEDSPSWRAFTGQTVAEMKGRGWLSIVHPRDRARIAEMWEHATRTGSAYQVEFRIRRADSEWRYVTTRGVPVREKDGKIREWVGYCVDITDIKNANDVILKERDFSNALISSLPGIFYVLDETGLNMRWNENLEKVSGYSSLEISKMRGPDFVADDEKQLLSERIHKVFDTGEADVELQLLTKSGERVPFYCTGRLVHLDGRASLVGVGIDVSELKRAEAENKRLNAELEHRVQERTVQLNEATKEMATFTYTASHDLRSPIRAIVGFARAIREDAAHLLDEESRLYLDRIIHASDRMMQLIDDLLKYCRVGQQAVHLRAVSIQKLIEEIFQEFEPRLKSVGGEVSMASDLPRVLGDSTLLHQIFDNLIENAITYRKQQEPLRIDVNWRKGVDDVVIFVSDNGIGIAPHHHQRIFEVFQRLHGLDDFPGTGIGLATVKRSVEKLGGEVWVESELGKGSVFCVRLKAVDNGGSNGS
ncbi:MAG: PAS domain S-box protein [Limisphaerales bacterium]